MFYAINEKTKEHINSLNLLDNPKYQFPEEESWIADWDEIENAEEIKEKFSNGVRVIYVNEKKSISCLGNEYKVSPHFRIPNASKLGINIIPESPEHRMAKNWIYQQLKNSDLKLYYSSVNKPFRYVNPLNLKELPIDKQKICIETNISNIKTRRVDIICPFIYTHPLLGNGIQFEIQFSKQRKKTKEERTFDAAFSGYSICWIGNNDFNKIDNNYIDIKKDVLKIDSFSTILKYSGKQQIKNIKFTVQEEMRKIQDFLNYNLEIFEEKIDDLIENKKEIVNDLFDEIKEQGDETKELINVINRFEGFCPNCKNKLIYKEGISKAGNQYKLYECVDTSCGYTKWV